MQGFFKLAAARLADRNRCPAVLQAEAVQDSVATLEMLALAPAVTALVHPLSDAATPVRASMTRVSQTEIWTFGVTLALVAPGGFEQFEPARDQIKAALRGWLPPGAATAVEYVGGQKLQYSLGKDGGRWLHLLRFRLSVQETYEANP